MTSSRLELIVDSSAAQRHLQRLDDHLRQVDSRGGAAAAAMGKFGLALGAISAAAGGLGFSRIIRDTANFEDSMLGLQAVSGATTKQMVELEKQARTLGATTRYSAQQAGEAQRFFAQAGFDTNEILAATPGILQLATAGQLDLARAADIASNALGQFQLPISDLARVNDVLATAAASANTNVEMIATSFRQVAPIASLAGASLEETAAIVSILGDSAIQGEQAGTGFRSLLSSLAKPSSDAESVLSKYGLTLDDVNVKTQGLSTVMERIVPITKDSTDNFTVFGQDAATVSGIIGNSIPRYKELTGELESSAGAAEAMAEIIGSGLSNSILTFNSGVSESILKLGEGGLGDAFGSLLDSTSGVLAVYNGLLPEFAEANDLTETQIDRIETLAGGVDMLKDAAIIAAGIYTGRFVAAMAAGTVEMAKNTQASIARAKTDAAAATASASRAAENLRVAQSEQAAAQRALANSRATAALTGSTANQTRALHQLAVANQRVLGAQAANTAALNTQSAAMGRASVAARAMGAASRGAAGAMALMGGPLGLLIGAGGLLIAFREELGLVRNAAEPTTERIDGLTDAINQNSVAAVEAGIISLSFEYFTLGQRAAAATAQIERLTKAQENDRQGAQARLQNNMRLRDLGEELAQVTVEQDAASESMKQLQGVLENLGKTVVPPANSLRTLGGDTEEAAKAAKTLADAYESLKRTLDPSYSSLMDFWEGIELLNKAIDTSTIEGMTEYNRMVGLLTERYAEATKGSDDAKKALEQLTQQYDRQYQRGVQLTQAISDISAAYRRGDIDGQQYGRMIQGVRDEMAQIALEADPMAQEMARAWEEASNRIDETFSDAFAGAFDSFDSFADQLLDGFKRLLSELAYQATLKPIVVGFTSDMQSMMSGGGGGFGNTIGAARSLFSSGSSLLGGGSTAAAAGGLYSGASTGLAAGGLYGNAVTGGVASTGIMSSITAGVSAAMPWIAGGLAIDSLLGGGITKAISGLFGGGKTPFYGRVGTSDNSANIQQYKTDTALGTTGFARVQRVEKATSEGTQEWAANLFEASKALDSVIASTARSTTELADMKAAVNGFSVASGNASTLVKAQLIDRTLVALAAAGHDVSAAWGNLGAEELAARVERASGAMGLMSASSERLNLQFDIASSSALVAADRISQLAGGVDQLAALQDSYYQAFFSDAERATNLQRELTQALSDMGYALPSTREGFRALVEQQDRFTESGQQNYVQLLQLSGAFDQMQTMLADTSSSVDIFASRLAELNDQIGTLEDDVRRAYQAFERQAFSQQLALLELMGDEQGALALQRERELQSIDPLLHEAQRHIWAMQDEAEAKARATQAANRYIGELSRIRDQLNSSIGSINQWIDQRTATSGTPGMNLEAAGEQFARQLVLAENGDRDALQNITQYADRYLAAGEGMFASGSGFQRIQEDVLASLEGLPEALSDAEFIVDGFRDIVSNEMAREIERAIFSSQYKIDTLIEFAADASKLPKDLRTILGEQAHRLDSTLNYLLGENQLDNELRRLALESTNNLVSTVDYITGFELSESDKLLALSSSNTMTAVIDYIVGSDIDRGSRILALEESNRYSAIVDMILGREISAADRRLALESTNDFTSVIDYVIRSPLTGGDRRLALSGNNSYEALIGYYVDRDVSQADRELALESGNRYLANIEYFVGRDISDDDRRLALSSNNRYVSVIDQIIGDQITGGDRRLALNSANSYLTTVDAVLESGIAADVRTFGLANSNSIMTTIDGVLASRLPSDVRTLALEDSNRFVTTLEAALADGRLTGDERKLLDARSETVVKTLKTNGLDLSKEEWAVINAASGTRRLELLADVAFGRTDLDELGKIEGNTKSLEERALDQLSELNSLVGEMTRTTDQFVGLNSGITSLTKSINALGVAQAEVARIEREREAAEKAERERIERERERAARESQINSNIAGFESAAAKAERQSEALSARLDPRDAGNITRLIDNRMDDGVFSNSEWQEMITHLSGVFGRDSLEYIFGREYAAMYRNQTRANEERAKLSAFADGGVFTNSVVSNPTMFDMGLMGEAGPEAIVPLHMGSDGLGIKNYSAPLPTLSSFPLLNQSDQAQVNRDLLNEVKKLRDELNRALNDVKTNTGNTADAVATAAVRAERQRSEQTDELRDVARNSRVRGRTV